MGEGSVNLFRASITIAALLALCPQCRADTAPIVHYAPAENLEHVDVALLDTARQEIDLAAYVLTDWPIIKALTRTADRGVKMRIYLDGTQLAGREPTKPFHDLADTPRVEIRTKHKPGAPMHLKSYQIDGRVLRTPRAFQHPASSARTMSLSSLRAPRQLRRSSAFSMRDLPAPRRGWLA